MGLKWRGHGKLGVEVCAASLAPLASAANPPVIRAATPGPLLSSSEHGNRHASPSGLAFSPDPVASRSPLLRSNRLATPRWHPEPATDSATTPRQRQCPKHNSSMLELAKEENIGRLRTTTPTSPPIAQDIRFKHASRSASHGAATHPAERKESRHESTTQHLKWPLIPVGPHIPHTRHITST